MIRFFYVITAFLVLAVLPVKAHAENQAKLMLIPTRIIMESDSKSATIELKNAGNATGQYSISLIDMEMQESGAVVAFESGELGPFSAIPILHASPKSVTIGPGESQTIRILQKRNVKVEPGEYRSHLRVKLENDNVEGSKPGKPVPSDQTAISVKANLVLIIPVILRVGETSYSVSIEAPQLAYDQYGKPKLEMYLLREGNRSSMGDFSISYKSPSGAEKMITFYPGVPVYRPTTRRFISVPLDVPTGTDLKHGSLEISYSAQEQEGGKLLAQKSLPLK